MVYVAWSLHTHWKMCPLEWEKVKRNFLARKSPSENTISGSIFTIVRVLLSCRGKPGANQTQALEVLEQRHGNILLTKEAWKSESDNHTVRYYVVVGLFFWIMLATNKVEAAKLEKPETSKHFWSVPLFPLCPSMPSSICIVLDSEETQQPWKPICL